MPGKAMSLQKCIIAMIRNMSNGDDIDACEKLYPKNGGNGTRVQGRNRNRYRGNGNGQGPGGPGGPG